jgi:lipoprotein-releasing system permease protein
MARDLSVDVLNMFNQMAVYMANRNNRNLQKPFKTSYLQPTGVFSIQQDIDNEYILVPFDFAISLLDREGMVGAWEIKIDNNYDIDAIEKQIQSQLGQDFQVQNRYEQDEEFRKIMNVEKWMAFAIAALMLLLIAFNLVGCLWMIVLDKRQDIAILKAMGSTSLFIRGLFIRLGIYFTGLGLSLGIFLATVFYILQKKFGIVGIPEGFVVDTYPIKMKGMDLVIVTITVLLIGFITSLPAANRASKFSASIREN